MRKIITLFLAVIGMMCILAAGEKKIIQLTAGGDNTIKVYKESLNKLALGKRIVNSYNWSATSQQEETMESIKTLNPESVFLLIDEMIGAEEMFEKYNTVKTCAFFDLDKDGILEIVAPLEDLCTACPTRLMVIKKSIDILTLFSFETMYGSIHNVVDLNKDGRYEIIVQNQEMGEATNTYAIYNSTVLAFRGDVIVDVSDEFPERYEQRKARLQKRIKDMEAELADLRTNANKTNWSNEHIQILIKNLETAIREHEQAIVKTEVLISRTASPKTIQ